MNDRYLFKAKRKNWKELPKEKWWVQGFLFQHMTEGGFEWCIGTEPLTANDYSEICGAGIDWFYIDESTLCQCTGLRDKEKKLIWENDVVYVPSFNPPRMIIKFIEGAFCLANKNGVYVADIHYIHSAGHNDTKVVGNIFDNLELLNETIKLD